MRIQPPGIARREARQVQPITAMAKVVAVAGIIVFWVALLGWIDLGGTNSLDYALGIFAFCQVPLILQWFRQIRVR